VLFNSRNIQQVDKITEEAYERYETKHNESRTYTQQIPDPPYNDVENVFVPFILV
jgi:hypothetical protein